ncbi:ELKS/Rab6-interacting/CAST family protein [Citrus sinensis]|nr:ELKS/Rab6-interacting/CAST family protein [Citrus sinensis]
MGFNAVYRCLMEMFPQIDTRLLKAVAIEHSKDADAAATIVLTEILPYWSEKSLTSSSVISNRTASSTSSKDLSLRRLSDRPSDEIAEHEEHEELNTFRRRRNRSQPSSLEQGSITTGYATSTDLPCAHNSDSVSLDKALNASAVSQSYDPNDSSGLLYGNPESEEVILLGKTPESVVEVGSDKASTVMPNECGNDDLGGACANTESNGVVSVDKGQYTDVKFESEHTPIVMPTLSAHANGLGATDIDMSIFGISQEVGSCFDCSLKVENSVAQFVPSSVQERASDVCQYRDVKVESEHTPIVMPTPSIHANAVANGSLTAWTDFDGPGATDIGVSNCGISQEVGSCLDCPLEVENSVAQLVTSNVPESGFQLEVGSNAVANGSLTAWTDFDGPGATDIGVSNCGISQEVGSCLDCPLEVENSVAQLVTSNVPESGLQSEVGSNAVANGSLTAWTDFDGPGATDIGVSNCGISQEVGSCLDFPLEVENSVAQLVPSSVQEHTSNVPESGFQLEVGSSLPSSVQQHTSDVSESGFHLEVGSSSTTDSGKPDANGSSDLMSKQENSVNGKCNIEDDSTITTIVTRSGQICRIDLLEEMIEDAKYNKKNLFKAMESVMNMMREVEIQERAAKEAKAAAVRGGLDIFVKMDELKQMLAHAKEANDMHAGEIYGERAILATEARELQNRLLSLSEERDKSLAVLDEMRETLEARLAAAEDMRKEAEEEKFEKEESARASLAEQEVIMEKVVQESKLLQQQAEENSKLREFLMDRGRVVDSLQ